MLESNRFMVHGANDQLARYIPAEEFSKLYDEPTFYRHTGTGADYYRHEHSLYALGQPVSFKPLDKQALASFLLTHEPISNRALHYCTENHYPQLAYLLQAFEASAGRERLTVADLAEAVRSEAGLYVPADQVERLTGEAWLADALDLANLEGIYLACGWLSKWRLYAKLGLSREAIRAFKRVAKTIFK